MKYRSSAIDLVRDADDKRERGWSLARCVRALAACKGNIQAAAEYARTKIGDEYIAKALSAGTGSEGGFVIPEPIAGEAIELVRARAVIRGMNPALASLINGNITLPGFATGSSAAYLSENSNVGITQPSFRQVKLSGKKLAALVPISNDLIRFNSPSTDTMVRDDLVGAVAMAEDAAFLRDDGTGDAPKGLRYQAAAGNVFAQTAAPTRAKVLADLSAMRLKLTTAKCRFVNPGWIMSYRTEEALVELTDANGNFILKSEMLLGRLKGFPYKATSQVPDNLGVGTDESELYLADFADVVIGDVPGMILDASRQAAYFDGADVVAAYSLDQTVVRLIMQNDLAVRHDGSIAVLTGVTWENPIPQA